MADLRPAGEAMASQPKPFFFIQLTDPQFGMEAQNAGFEKETANFKRAIAAANRLKPAFVIVTGDLVNQPGDRAQADEYLRIAATLDRSIPLYQLPGNHDLGNNPTAESLAAYTARFGPDHFSIRQGNLLGLALDSCLIGSEAMAKEAREQEAWLKSELEKARQENVRHILVFQHHPWFIQEVNEADAYENLPRAERRHYLDLFHQYGVSHVFAGHYHANAVAHDGPLEMVTTGAVGKPLRKSQSGLRIVIVRDRGIEHRFYGLDEIPERIELAPLEKAAPSRSMVPAGSGP
jgi:3',5'-cyclic AMP phosphodiesterase CpdA